MTRNFYFGKDADVVKGSANFASLIATDFATYGISSAQSGSFGLLDTALQSAYTAAVNPPTRGPVSIQAKNVALKKMRSSAINLSHIIYSTVTVDDSQLVALGLLPRATYTPRNVPSLPPMVEVISCAGRVVTVRVHDIESERRGLPFGATSALIYSFVGETAPSDPGAYKFQGPTTRATMKIVFPDSVASGATIWLSAQWASARGELSVGSTAISFTIQGGNVAATA